MIRLKQFLLSALIFIFCSCKNEQRNSYAIKDFRKSLQPFLFKIVTTGIVTYYDSSLIKSITDDELIRLSKSENPILRATALGEMLDRSSFNQFDVVMNHLDDTAIVATDNGEFGIRFETVSDYLIGRTSWETLLAKNKTIDEVLTKHNYLRSAYTILLQIKPQEKYYLYIKDMATRPRRLDRYDGDELDFGDIEYALYGLAKFKKKEDVQIINNKLMEHVWELSDISFRLMKEFPDTEYMDVLQTYHRRQFYEFSGNRPHGFTGYNADKAAPEDFIDALVVQQNDRSAKLLDTMLTYLPMYKCMPDKENIINEVITAIWEHPCPAYARLREKIRPKAEEIFKGRLYIKVNPIDIQGDTTKRTYNWYN
ncbi:MAG TPA: hypothetical protein VHD35_13540 [Chitinophagaceae bacterium]|nr:hypothetical protein [Chitinophagaceae bacterium]